MDSTLMQCMGLTENRVPNSAPITPGVGDILLPQSFIDSVKSMNDIFSPSSSNWDTGSSYDTVTRWIVANPNPPILQIAHLLERMPEVFLFDEPLSAALRDRAAAS